MQQGTSHALHTSLKVPVEWDSLESRWNLRFWVWSCFDGLLGIFLSVSQVRVSSDRGLL